MQTIEVSFLNPRQEKITADAVSITDAPGRLTVAETIASRIIKLPRFLPEAAARPTEAELQSLLHPQILTLPKRPEPIHQPRHLFTPLIRARAAAERRAA